MAFRTPTADGLGTAPASTQELQAHRYWGRYAATAITGDGLPNTAANPAADPAFSKLSEGDVAYNTTDSCLYVCTFRGTLSGGDATWACMTTAALTQTIRDAHVLVVGQSGTLAPLAAAGSPPLPADLADLSAVTGDVVGITVDYLDPGDGTQLELALTAAAAGGTPIDIRLRPCAITLDPATLTAVPLVLPADCRLIGASRNESTITGGDGTGATTQSLFTMASGSAVEALKLISPAPVAAPAATELGMLNLGIGCEVLECTFVLSIDLTPTFDREQNVCVYDLTATCKITGCSFTGANGYAQATLEELVAVQLGSYVGSAPVKNVTPLVNDCDFLAWNVAIAARDVGGVITLANIRVRDAEQSDGTIRVRNQNPGTGIAPSIMHVSNLSIFSGTADIVGAPANRVGVLLQASTASIGGLGSIQGHFTGVTIAFQPQAQAQYDIGYRLLADVANGECRATVFGGMVAGADVGFQGDCAGVASTINSVRVSGLIAEAMGEYGVQMIGAGGNIDRCGFANCDFGNAGFDGVELDGGCNDTHVIGNYLKGAGTLPLDDGGVGTEAAHNII